MKKGTIVAISTLGLVLLFAMSSFESSAASYRLSGAVFTSLEDGSTVNANLYPDKRDVYLNAGPGPNAPQTAAGLPDGNYYFQVTDPSGKTLLSSDPVLCREFRVEDGVIAEYVSIGRTYMDKGKVVPCYKDGWQFGMHDLGYSVDHGSLTIQLMPYDNTPNRGGVYKLWATPIDKFVGDPNKVDNNCGNGCFHGFIPAWSKTDNFKAQFRGKFDAPIITVRKFIDTDGDGIWDEGEPEVGVDIFIDGGGWPVYVDDPNGVTTDGYTQYLYTVGMKGTHVVYEDMLPGWSPTVAIVDGVSYGATDTVNVEISYTSGETHEVVFGNFECFTVSGYKYEDMNGNGIVDIDDPVVSGWTVELYRNGELFATTTTDSNGYYTFEVCIGGDFEVKEVVPSGWTATGETSFFFAGASGQSQSFDFLNFRWFTVEGYKYNDLNGNGLHESEEPGIEGWYIYLYKGSELIATAITDSSGYYSFTVTEPGLYTVVEEVKSGWVATYPESGEFEFTAVSGQSWTFNFLNFKEGKICGYKWYDVNMNGVKDGNEVYIEGFKVELYKNGDLYATVYTDSSGQYCFENLLWGTYTVKEIMPSNPGQYYSWEQIFPVGDGTWTVEITSGYEKLDANFGNVVNYTAGLTWGYWKTHTGYDSPLRDPAYDLLPDNPMSVDVQTPDGDYLVETDYEAKWVFEGAGSGDPPNCSGDCRSLFRAQLLALHMNLLKFDDMGSATYYYAGDGYSGWTVQQIYDEAIDLLTDGQPHDFTSLQMTIDRINNNGEGTHVLVLSSPPPIVY